MARLSRIAPEVPVSDLKRAVSFYEQKLGFTVVTDLDGADYAIVERDDVAIHLFRDTSGTLTPVGLHIFTNELEELQTELQQRGTLLAQQIMRSLGAIAISA